MKLEGLKSPEASRHGQRVQTDLLVDTFVPVEIRAAARICGVKCCVPVSVEPCFWKIQTT